MAELKLCECCGKETAAVFVLKKTGDGIADGYGYFGQRTPGNSCRYPEPDTGAEDRRFLAKAPAQNQKARQCGIIRKYICEPIF
jgi:hypothetical protein